MQDKSSGEPGVHSETYLCGMRIYHEVSGTLGIPMSVTVIDPDTNMKLDRIDDFDWIQQLTQMEEDEKTFWRRLQMSNKKECSRNRG